MPVHSLYTDEAMLQLMANDDIEGFTMIYRRYWEDLYKTSAKALRDKDAAADVVQDVFLSLWHRRHELDIENSLAAYLHTSVRYKAIHYIEKNISRCDYLAQLTEVEANSLPSTAGAHLEFKEVQTIIQNTVDRMPPKMQAVYRLSRMGHRSHKEIAAELEISVETVKKHIQHAMQMIKDALSYTTLLLLIEFLYVAG